MRDLGPQSSLRTHFLCNVNMFLFLLFIGLPGGVDNCNPSPPWHALPERSGACCQTVCSLGCRSRLPGSTVFSRKPSALPKWPVLSARPNLRARFFIHYGTPGLVCPGPCVPYEFIGSGAMDVTKPYESIGSEAMDVTKPYEFIGSGAG